MKKWRNTDGDDGENEPTGQVKWEIGLMWSDTSEGDKLEWDYKWNEAESWFSHALGDAYRNEQLLILKMKIRGRGWTDRRPTATIYIQQNKQLNSTENFLCKRHAICAEA